MWPWCTQEFHKPKLGTWFRRRLWKPKEDLNVKETYPFQHGSFLVYGFTKFKSFHPGYEFDQENTKSKNIRFLRRLTSREIFWCNVPYSATNSCCHMRISMVKKLSQAKVTDNSLTVIIQENISSLNITVNYFWIALLMQIEKTSCSSNCNSLSSVPV